jgi:hypothetical protein
LLLALEAAARVRQQRIDASNPYVVAYRRRQAIVRELYPATLWDLPMRSYKKSSHLRIDRGGVLLDIKTNSLGFRGEEIPAIKAPGALRVICLGGSTTFEGSTNDRTYPAILQDLLQREFGARIDVINAGMSARGSYGELEALDQLFELQPDVVVEHNFINDLAWFIVPQVESERGTWSTWLGRARILRPWVGTPLADLERSIDAFTFSNLREMARRCRERGVSLALASFARPSLRRSSQDERDFWEWELSNIWRMRWTSFGEYCACVDHYNRALTALGAEVAAPYIPVAEGIDGTSVEFMDVCHMRDPTIGLKAHLVLEQLRPLIAMRLDIHRNERPGAPPPQASPR